MQLPMPVESSDGKSVEFSTEKIVNFYVETGKATAKSPAVLLGRPGLSLFCTVGDGPIRGAIEMGGDVYVVSGLKVFRKTASETIEIGDVTGSGPVSMITNGFQVAIAADNRGYIATETSFDEITTDAFPGAGTFAYIDNMAIYSEPNSGRFGVSRVGDLSAYNALDFATAEAQPDNLIAVAENNSFLFAFGEKTTQVYYNNGNVDFPWASLNDIVIDRGLGARFSVAKEDNTLFFLGDDGLVYRFNGFTPFMISTPAIATKIAGYSKSLAVGTFIDYEQHKFYVLSFPEATLVYDLVTGLWSEWETNNGNWIGQFSLEAFGKKLVTDRSSNKIYFLDDTVFTDDGSPMISTVRFPPVHQGRRRGIIRWIEIDMDSGVSTQNEGRVIMRVSWDGQRWTQPRAATYGKPGESLKRAIFRKWGQMERQVHIEASISDEAPRRIVAGHIEID